eukprot:gene24871-biopygen11944
MARPPKPTWEQVNTSRLSICPGMEMYHRPLSKVLRSSRTAPGRFTAPTVARGSRRSVGKRHRRRRGTDTDTRGVGFPGRPGVDLVDPGWIRGRPEVNPGVNPGSTRDQPGINPGSTRGRHGVDPGSIRGVNPGPGISNTE